MISSVNKEYVHSWLHILEEHLDAGDYILNHMYTTIALLKNMFVNDARKPSVENFYEWARLF